MRRSGRGGIPFYWAVVCSVVFLAIGLGIGIVVAPGGDACAEPVCPAGPSGLVSGFTGVAGSPSFRTAYTIDRAMYDAMDADGNGTVSPAEFEAYMNGVLRYVDDDSDGSMSFEEAAGGNGPEEGGEESEGGPTLSPTLSPTTSNPTLSPSTSPTLSPSSSEPTNSPTQPPTGSPTTSTPTTSPTSSPTVAGVAHSGDITIASSTDPAVLSTANYPVTTSVIGYLLVQRNPGLSTMGNAFGRLVGVEGQLQIESNNALTTLGAAFPVLVELGTAGNGISLYVHENPALVTLGTAFASLRRISGTLFINNNRLLTNFEALRQLECHGGVYNNDPWRSCMGCPAWLLALPQC